MSRLPTDLYKTQKHDLLSIYIRCKIKVETWMTAILKQWTDSFYTKIVCNVKLSFQVSVLDNQQ